MFHQGTCTSMFEPSMIAYQAKKYLEPVGPELRIQERGIFLVAVYKVKNISFFLHETLMSLEATGIATAEPTATRPIPNKANPAFIRTSTGC